jgi:RNA polymerase sigma-70 factor (ECF subfamily)
MINFKELYESYASDVHRFALWISGDPQEADDITSETFIRAWVHRKKIRTETLKAYLFTIARNTYLQHQRKRRNFAVLEDVHPAPGAGPDRLAESHFELDRVQEFLQTVSETDRAAFVLRVQHDLPYEEISRILDVCVSAARVKVYRVRKRLIAICITKEAAEP